MTFEVLPRISKCLLSSLSFASRVEPLHCGKRSCQSGLLLWTSRSRVNLRNFDDLGIIIVPFEETFYCRKCEQLVTERECEHLAELQERCSGTKLRKIIRSERYPPPKVIKMEVYNVIKASICLILRH